MTHYDQHHALQSLTLGKPTPYRERYDPSLRQAVPRALNRDPLLRLQTAALLFHGADIWTLYELYWLNDAGFHGNNALRRAKLPRSRRAGEGGKTALPALLFARTGLTGRWVIVLAVMRRRSPAPGQNGILILLYVPA